ncbi:hypothetical protein FGG08_004428 [Glutinoglossum americanum]|uniref:Uncharacterized protein n=1 Tax=Glutinoglossum americanum TaxID=1670608 RepID=A0A9P8I9A3_9PEZI|nr:hypothetical protein FGG08_004428 [Glutinoglossum americanum]
MDTPSGFQEEIDWILAHGSSTEAPGTQEREALEPPLEIPAIPLAQTEAAQMMSLDDVRASCHYTDEGTMDSSQWKSDSSLVDTFTGDALGGHPGTAKGDNTGWGLAEKNEEVPKEIALWGALHPTAPASRQTSEKKPSKGAVKTLADGLSVFPSSSDVSFRIRGRKRFSLEKRMEVNKCGEKDPCKQLLNRTRREISAIHPEGPSEIAHLSAVGGVGGAPALRVSVVKAHFDESVRLSDTGAPVTAQRQGYVLAPKELPSSQYLKKWAIDCGLQTYARPWIAFSLRYCQHSLPQSAIMFWCLKALLKRCFFILDNPAGTARRLSPAASGSLFVASNAIQSQLENLLSRLVARTERGFLAELHRAVYDSSSAGRDKVLTLFLSIWISGHTYAFFSAVASAYGDRKEEAFFGQMSRLNRAIQKAKFRSSYPLNEAIWSKVPHYAIIASDPELLKAMAEIRTWEKGKPRSNIVPTRMRGEAEERTLAK